MISYLAFAATSTALFGVSLAGIQVPLVMVNLSPYEASVDMTLDENCIKHDFNPSDLGHYYDSWESNNLGNFDRDFEPLNAYLQQYKTMFGLPKLRDNKSLMYGITTIPPLVANPHVAVASPYMVFETEMDGSGSCFGSHSRKSFNVTVNGKTRSFTLEDPPTSEWTLTMTDPDNKQILLGSGGTDTYDFVIGQPLLDANVLNENKGFTDIYDTLAISQRRACILGRDILSNYDCDVAGVSLIIQSSGDIFAAPLPNIYRAWN